MLGVDKTDVLEDVKKTLVDEGLYTFYNMLKQLGISKYEKGDKFIWWDSLEILAETFKIPIQDLKNKINRLAELWLAVTQKKGTTHTLRIGSIENDKVIYFNGDKSLIEPQKVERPLKQGVDLIVPAKETAGKKWKKDTEYLTKIGITGKLQDLVKEEVDIVNVQLLYLLKSKFFNKFEFVETAPLYKQYASLKCFLSGTEIAHGEILKCYEYGLNHYEEFKLSSLTIAAFCAYFTSIYTKYKKSDGNNKFSGLKKSDVDIEKVIDNFNRRHNVD